MLISRKPFQHADIGPRPRAVGGGRHAGGLPAGRREARNPVPRPAAQRPTRTSTSATTRSTSRRSPTTGRSSSTPCSRATCGTSSRTASRDSADYKVNKAVPLLFGLMAISLAGHAADPGAAAAGAGHAPAAAAGRARIPAVLPVHRRRLHPDRGGADPEIRAVPGPSHVRPDGGDLLACWFRAGWGAPSAAGCWETTKGG